MIKCSVGAGLNIMLVSKLLGLYRVCRVTSFGDCPRNRHVQFRSHVHSIILSEPK